jgi:hypothetical protein
VRAPRLVGQSPPSGDLGPESPARGSNPLLLGSFRWRRYGPVYAHPQALDAPRDPDESPFHGGDHDRSFTSTDDALSDGRELSAISRVARGTVTPVWQRGHLGVSVLPLTPSRYESGAPQ